MSFIPYVTKKIEKICCTNKWLIHLCSSYYKNVVKNEVELAQINKNDLVLCIGGGALPCTALQIVKYTGARVDVIDNDPKAVELSRKVIQKLNLNKQIEINLSEGACVDCCKYSVIHVALQATPRLEIMKNLMKCACKGTRILMRVPKDALRTFYRERSEYDTNVLTSVEQKSATMKATLMFVKGLKNNEIEKDIQNYSIPSVSTKSVAV